MNLNPHARPPASLLLLVAVIVSVLAPAQPLDHANAQGDGLEELRWTAADSPFVLASSVEVEPGVRLVIEAGVEVRFDEGVGLQVRGALTVEGTEARPVRFVPNTTGAVEPNHWGDVRLVPARADLESTVEWAEFQGADSGLLVSSARAVIGHSTFTKNRYGVLARGSATVEVTDCDFINNSVLGLEWESGADGFAEGCDFEENVVGVYCYQNVSPLVRDCEFRANYHHLSFAKGGNATVESCVLLNSSAETVECYWNSSPLFRDVTFSEPDESTLFLRHDSRPRFEGGTPLSKLEVMALDERSYGVAIVGITILVVDDLGTPLEGANVSLLGASGDAFGRGTTNANGRLSGATMSTYTVGGGGGNDAENPHSATVDWNGHNKTFRVTPRELDKFNTLVLELDLSPPEASGPTWWLNILLILVIGVVLIVVLSRRVGRSGE